MHLSINSPPTATLVERVVPPSTSGGLQNARPPKTSGNFPKPSWRRAQVKIHFNWFSSFILAPLWTQTPFYSLSSHFWLLSKYCMSKIIIRKGYIYIYKNNFTFMVELWTRCPHHILDLWLFDQSIINTQHFRPWHNNWTEAKDN